MNDYESKLWPDDFHQLMNSAKLKFEDDQRVVEAIQWIARDFTTELQYKVMMTYIQNCELNGRQLWSAFEYRLKKIGVASGYNFKDFLLGEYESSIPLEQKEELTDISYLYLK